MSIKRPFAAFCKIKFLQLSEKTVPLHRVFHSIRFKVNKIGVQRYSFFLCLNVKPEAFVMAVLSAKSMFFATFAKFT